MLILASSMVLFIEMSEGVDAAVLKVGKDQTYSTIQAAINQASDGDTIEVHAGTYDENIEIDKILTIVGNGTSETFIEGDGTDNVITITSNWVNVSQIGISSDNVGSYAGIRIDSGYDNIKIENCNLSNNYYGVNAYGSSSSIIDNLVIANSTANWTDYGFYLRYCDNAFIHNNFASYNDDYGIYFYYCDYGMVQNNTCDYSTYGIRPYYSDYSKFQNNSLTGNNYGIYSYYADYSELHNNELKENNDWGIYVYNSEYHKAENNTIVDCGFPFSQTGDFGLEVYSSGNSWVKNNTFTGCGAYMDQSTTTEWGSLVIQDNEVNSNDLRFYNSINSVTVPSGTGQVILYNCNDIDIDGLDLSNASIGVQAFASWSIEVSDCDLGYNYYGVEIDDPSTDMVYNNITDSYFNRTGNTAIRLYTSTEDAAHNIIDGNYIVDGDMGIEMDVSSSTTDSGYYNKIRNNTIMNMTDYGIDVEYLGRSNISNNVVEYADDGIYFSSGSSSKNHYCTIENNTVIGGGYGIRSYYNYYSTIKNNTIKESETYGLYCNYADYADVGDNYIENIDGRGIYISGADYSFFHGNTIKNANDGGIYLASGGNNRFRYNTMENCGFYISSTSTTYWSTTTIDTTNQVNSGDVVILYNTANPTIPSTAGQIMLHTCDDADIDGIEIKDTTVGIWIYNSDDVTIENSKFENMSTGLDIDTCARIRILNNTISNCTEYGIYHDDSDNAHIFNNTITDCGYPYHEDGDYGVYVYYTNNLYFENNSMTRCGVYVYGSTTTSYYTTHAFSNNTVNSRELAYINGQSSQVLTGTYGQVLIINSDHITLKDQNLSDSTMGIFSVRSDNINIRNVSSNNNYRGIYFYPGQASSDNRFENISCNYNREEGMYFYSSSTYTADNILVANSTFSNNGKEGLDLYYLTSGAWIENNEMENNVDYGLRLYGSSTYNVKWANITSNSMAFNGDQGAYLYYVTDSIIEENSFDQNTDYGIDLHYGDGCSIENNTASGNLLDGFYIYDCDKTDVKNNLASENHDDGFYIYKGLLTSDNGEFSWNNASMNDGYGLNLQSDYHNINNNTFHKNVKYGLYISGTYGDDNTILMNKFIENNGISPQALDNEANNDWDDGSKGNYWSDHQTPDVNKDGIVEGAYSIEGTANARDHYPLVLGNIPPRITTTDVENANPETLYSNDYDASDINGDTLTWSLNSNGSFLSIVASTGVLSGTPAEEDASKTFWVNVTVSDGNGGTDWRNFTLKIGAGNSPPSITTIDVTVVSEDATYSVDYDATDQNADTLTWSLHTNADFLRILAATGVVSGVPDNGDIGLYFVNVSVSDGNGGTDWTNFTLRVTNVNDDPEITTSPITTGTEDMLYSEDFDATDIDPSGDTLTWSLNTDANFLSIVSTTGVVSGTPDDSGVGSWFVNVTVSDGNGGTDWENYTLTISNINDAPRIITSDVLIAIEDIEYSVDYDFDDPDPAGAGDIHRWTLLTNIPVTWLTIDARTGVLSGTPTNDNVGTLGVTVTIDDGQGGSDSHKFDLIIQNVNDDPVITNPISGTYDWDEDLYSEIDFEATDVDTDYTFTWNLITDADWLSIDSSTGILSGNPTNAKVGTWNVNVTVSDGDGGLDWNEFDIEVKNTNDAPNINSATLEDAVEDDPYWHIFIASDMDPTDDTLTWSFGSNCGFLSIDPETGNLSGTPANEDVGEWWVNITVDDGNGGSDNLNVTLTVTNTNDPPVIESTSLPDATEDISYYHILEAYDMDPSMDTIFWSIKETDADFLTMDPGTGNLSFLPINDDVGEYWILIQVTDPYGGFDEFNFSLTVLNVNDDPVIGTETLPAATEDVEYWFVLNGTDIDPTNDLLTWAINGSSAAFLTIDPETGNLSGTPDNDDVGIWWVNISLDDGKGIAVWKNLTISVDNVNDGPVLNQTSITLSMDEDSGSTSVDLNDVFLDVDGDELTFSYSSGENFTVSIEDGVAIITPVDDFNGFENIEFSATDGIETMSLDVSIEVSDINDPPFGLDINYNASYIEGENQIVNASAEDVDGDDLTFTWRSNVSGEIGTGWEINLSLAPGSHTITLNVTDGNGGWIEDSINVEIKEKVIEKPDDKKDDEFPWWIIILAIVALLVLVIIIIILVARRKKDDKKEGVPTTEQPPEYGYQESSPEQIPQPEQQQGYNPQIQYQDTFATQVEEPQYVEPVQQQSFQQEPLTGPVEPPVEEPLTQDPPLIEPQINETPIQEPPVPPTPQEGEIPVEPDPAPPVEPIQEQREELSQGLKLPDPPAQIGRAHV